MEQNNRVSQPPRDSFIANGWDKRTRTKTIAYAVGSICALACVYLGFIASRHWLEGQEDLTYGALAAVPELAEGEQRVYERTQPNIPGFITVRAQGDLYVVDVEAYGSSQGQDGTEVAPSVCTFRAEGTALHDTIVAHFVPSPGVTWTEEEALKDPRFAVIRFSADDTLVIERADGQDFCGLNAYAEGTYQLVEQDATAEATTTVAANIVGTWSSALRPNEVYNPFQKLFIFNADGTFTFYNDLDSIAFSRIVAVTGTWSVDDAWVYTTLHTTKKVSGGEIVQVPYTVNRYLMRGGTGVIVEEADATSTQTLELPLQPRHDGGTYLAWNLGLKAVEEFQGVDEEYVFQKSAVFKKVSNTPERPATSISDAWTGDFKWPVFSADDTRLPWADLTPDILVGTWHASPIMPSGWAERIMFYDDGTYEFLASQMVRNPIVKSESGRWSLQQGRLVLEMVKGTTARATADELMCGSLYVCPRDMHYLAEDGHIASYTPGWDGPRIESGEYTASDQGHSWIAGVLKDTYGRVDHVTYFDRGGGEMIPVLVFSDGGRMFKWSEDPSAGLK